MERGVARVLVRYGAAGDPGDSGVDPEKTQAKEEEEEEEEDDDGEDEFVCVCVLRFLRFSLSLSPAFDVVSFHFCSLPGYRYLVSKCRTCCYSFFLLLEKFSAAILMSYCAVYCHGKLVRGGGSWARGKESWRERDSRKGGRVSGTVLVASETIEDHRLSGRW